MTLAGMRALLRELRAKLPTDLPVRVRRVPLRSAEVGSGGITEHGYCYRRTDHYMIYVNSNDHGKVQEETLGHEYAHALAYPLQADGAKMSHNHKWGDCYSRVTRVYENKFLREPGLEE